MSTNVIGNSNTQSTPASTPNQNDGSQAATARHVLKPAIIATLVIYLSNLGIAAGIHFTLNEATEPSTGPTEWNAYWITVLIAYAGAVFGWLVGFMVSPYDKREEKRLTRVASWISLLFSGYLLGRLEPSAALLFSKGELITERLYGVRVLFFLINVVCTGITVYLYRLYGEGSPSVEAHSNSKHRG
jgi:hypothetical protein